MTPNCRLPGHVSWQGGVISRIVPPNFSPSGGFAALPAKRRLVTARASGRRLGVERLQGWLKGCSRHGVQRAAAVFAVVGLVAVLSPALPPATVASAQNVETAPAVEPTAAWAKTMRETGIWSGWDSKAQEFAKIGKDITVQLIELRGPRAYVFFPGDGKGHKPGEVWIDRADLADAPWPRWARARRATFLRTTPDLGSEEVIPLSRGQYVETTGETRGRWAQAFYLIDRAPGEWAMGWVDGLDLMLPRGEQTEITSYMLTRTTLMTSTPEVWLRVPYRSQIDGSSYAEANCGPTSVAMALEALGKSEPLGTLRELALDLQQNPRCDDCGTYIQHLAAVAEMRGAKTYGLRHEDGAFRRWSLDDIRAELRQQRVVIPQVKYRHLPGRSNAGYGGDHYLVIVGISGQSFIYNDPVDSDGRGYGRLITAEQLEAAMSNANGEFARVAFAVGR
jgi:hypothetical protein